MIRTADHHDLKKILEIGRQTLEAAPTYPVKMDDVKASYIVRRCISDRNMEAFVSVVDGEVVGFILAVQEEHFFSKDWYATDMCFCVLPDHVNQAVWLLRRFIRWAKKNPKVKSIMLGVSSGLDVDGRLGQLYEKHGLENAGGLHVKVFGDGV